MFYKFTFGYSKVSLKNNTTDRNYIRLPQNRGMIYKRLNVITGDWARIETGFIQPRIFQQKIQGNPICCLIKLLAINGDRH